MWEGFSFEANVILPLMTAWYHKINGVDYYPFVKTEENTYWSKTDPFKVDFWIKYVT